MKARSKHAVRQVNRLASDVEVWLAIVARVVARIAQEKQIRKVKG